MSVLLKRATWWQFIDRDTSQTGTAIWEEPVDLTDSISMDAVKGIDIKNNVCKLSLKNPAQQLVTEVDASTWVQHKYINSDKEVMFGEQDQIKVWARYTDDGADIEATQWTANSSTYPSSDYLLGTYYIINHGGAHNSKSNKIEITAADKTYIIFNKVLAQAFTNSDNINAPEILQTVIRIACEKYDQLGIYPGTGNDAGVTYDIQADLVSEGGYILNYRRAIREDGTANVTTTTTLNGAINSTATTITLTDASSFSAAGVVQIEDELIYHSGKSGNDLTGCTRGVGSTTAASHADTTTTYDCDEFPDIAVAKVWKPIYEWGRDLSTIEHTNDSDELAGTYALTYGRPMILWIDEANKVHWVYPSNVVDNTLVVGTDDIYSIKMNKDVFDVTNMIIFNCGDDMYSTGIWDYKVDDTSNARTLKMRVLPFTDIAEKWKNEDYAQGISAANREGTPAGYPLYQFPVDAQYGGGLSACVFVPTTTYATSTDITDDTMYNGALRERCLVEGGKRASTILQKLAHARWKGTMEVKLATYTPGNLIELTDTEQGLNAQKLRIMDVKYNIRKNGGFVTLSLEEDPITIAKLG